MQIGGTYAAEGRNVWYTDSAFKHKTCEAQCTDTCTAELFAHAMNFLCRTAAEAVSQADILFTYSNNDKRL